MLSSAFRDVVCLAGMINPRTSRRHRIHHQCYPQPHSGQENTRILMIRQSSRVRHRILIALTRTIWPDLRAHGARFLSERSGLPELDCPEYIQAIYTRRRVLKWVPPAAAALAFFGWMFAFGRITDILENTNWDLLAFLYQLGLPGWTIVVVLGYGIATALAIVLAAVIPRTVLRHEVRRCLHSPACFWCAYSLRGLEIRDSRVRCPECGRSSPVALLRHP